MIALLTIALAAALPAQAADAGNTRVSVAARAAATHARLDTNRDGFVTRAEIAGGLAQSRGEAPPTAAPSTLSNTLAERLFVEADTNGDSRLSREEQVAAAERSFDLADRDRDGKVTADEWFAAIAQGQPAAPPAR